MKGLGLDVVISAEAEQEVVGDLAALRQVTSCLLSNAVKFTSQGWVRVEVSRASGAWRFEVADTGEGFDLSRKAELFAAFGRNDVTATRAHGGMGLGLALANRLVTDLGGRLECQSSPGVGSRFSFEVELPAAAGAADAPADDGRSADPSPAAEPSLRVLIVDDNATNRKVLEVILDQIGVEWVSVADGQQAVDAASAQVFDAILMDIQMPVMDGLAATREIRRREQAASRRPTPVLIVSANGQPEHVQAGLAAGAQAHLCKPVSPGILVEALTRVLGQGPAAAAA